jgi:hypothetical protein
VVLAAASPDPTDAVGLVGPGSAAIGKTLPVGIGTVARIREALKTEVRLDPSLPVALAARRPPLERPSGITPSPFASFVNMVVIVGLVVFVWRYVANGAGPDTSRPGGRRSSHP